jgi:hypothetical protein
MASVENIPIRRSLAGVVGAVASVVILVTTLVSLALLEASFRTWTVGRFFSGRAGAFADVFMVGAVLSVITFILSCFAVGKPKITGLCASGATIFLVVLIFWTGA